MRCCTLKNKWFADSDYQDAVKRPEANGMGWHATMCPGKCSAQKYTPWGALNEQAEKLKAGVRAKVRYRGLAKTTLQLITLCALSNIWMVTGRLMQIIQG